MLQLLAARLLRLLAAVLLRLLAAVLLRLLAAVACCIAALRLDVALLLRLIAAMFVQLFAEQDRMNACCGYLLHKITVAVEVFAHKPWSSMRLLQQ